MIALMLGLLLKCYVELYQCFKTCLMFWFLAMQFFLFFTLSGKTIQSSRNGHNSVEDAQTALELFKRVRSKWEVELFEKWRKKGVDVTHTIAQLEHAEAGLRTNVRDEVDYLSDKFWPSDLLTS